MSDRWAVRLRRQWPWILGWAALIAVTLKVPVFGGAVAIITVYGFGISVVIYLIGRVAHLFRAVDAIQADLRRLVEMVEQDRARL